MGGGRGTEVAWRAVHAATRPLPAFGLGENATHADKGEDVSASTVELADRQREICRGRGPEPAV